MYLVASLLSTIYYLLSTIYYLLSTIFYLLSTIYYLLSTIYYLLSTIYLPAREVAFVGVFAHHFLFHLDLKNINFSLGTLIDHNGLAPCPCPRKLKPLIKKMKRILLLLLSHHFLSAPSPNFSDWTIQKYSLLYVFP